MWGSREGRRRLKKELYRRWRGPPVQTASLEISASVSCTASDEDRLYLVLRAPSRLRVVDIAGTKLKKL